MIEKIRSELKEKIIIDKLIIKKIRLNIEKENKSIDKKTKAFLFSSEIKKLCNEEIKDFKYKDELLKDLLVKFISENELNCDDIYQKVINKYKNDDEFSLDMSDYIKKTTVYKNIRIEDELKINFNRNKILQDTKNESILDLKSENLTIKKSKIENVKNEEYISENISKDSNYESNESSNIKNEKLNLKELYTGNVLVAKKSNFKTKKFFFILISIFILFFGYVLIKPIYLNNEILIEENEVNPYEYKEFDYEKLKQFLREKNSLLAEDIYFNQIISASKEKDLNPLILFAIASHEQGYVKKDHPDAKKIINNPFNVFYSWKKYNTNLKDSADIAARTVYNLSLDRPKDVEYFKWINRKYAQDENWHKGVSWIFNKMQEVILEDEEGKKKLK
ncbi:hypothetical protein WG909_12635 [Peptostreptococcaceae bacterium AGR-M142]